VTVCQKKTKDECELVLVIREMIFVNKYSQFHLEIKNHLLEKFLVLIDTMEILQEMYNIYNSVLQALNNLALAHLLDFSFFPTIPLPANSLQTWWLSMAP
jgi:hypothetical protein